MPWAYLFTWVLAVGLLAAAFFVARSVRPKRRRSRLGVGLLVSLSVFLFSLASLETVFRYFIHLTDSHMRTQMTKKWLERYVGLNRSGFRDPERAVRPALGSYRIMMLGDSMLFGVGTDCPQHRFSNRLAAKLSADADRKVEVINAAKPGWSTRAEKNYFLEYGEKHNNDLVIVAYYVNDILGLSPDEPKYTFAPGPVADGFIQRFYCVDFLWRGLDPGLRQAVRDQMEWIKGAYNSEQQPGVREAHQGDLVAIKNACDRQGAKLLVVILPLPVPEELQDEVRGVHQDIREILTDGKIDFVDLWKELENESAEKMVVSRWDKHLSVYGNERVAEKIYEYLIEKNAVPPERTSGP